MLGGLPVTSVVVRTSANVYAGAMTWVSSFIHGLLLFASTMLIPSVLNLTPLSCLAAILIVIGYKLTKPKVYQEMYKLGWSQFIPFIVTVTGDRLHRPSQGRTGRVWLAASSSSSAPIITTPSRWSTRTTTT